MQYEGVGGGYRSEAREALERILESRMDNRVDAYLEERRAEGFPDHKNGSYRHYLLTELLDLWLRIPRTQTFSARVLLKRLARRAFPVERLILLCLRYGLSIRKVDQALLSIMGERVSHGIVNQIGKQLDQAV